MAERKNKQKISMYEAQKIITLYGTEEGKIAFPHIDLMSEVTASNTPFFNFMEIPSRWECKRQIQARYGLDKKGQFVPGESFHAVEQQAEQDVVADDEGTDAPPTEDEEEEDIDEDEY